MLLLKSKIYTSKLRRKEGDIFRKIDLLRDNLISNRIIVSLYLLKNNLLRKEINTAQVLRYGSLGLIKLALLQDLIFKDSVIEISLVRGSGEVYDYMKRYCEPTIHSLISRSSISGNTPLTLYFLKDLAYNVAAVLGCIKSGNVNLLKYIVKRYNPKLRSQISRTILLSHDKHTFNYLESIHKKYSKRQLDYLLLLRSCYFNPQLEDYIKTKINTEEEVCAICLEDLYSCSYKERTSIKCNHIFHKACLREHLKNKNDCPLCRKQISHIALLKDEIREIDLEI